VFPPLTPPETVNLESDWHGTVGSDNRQSIWSTSQMSERLAEPYTQRNASGSAKKALDAATQTSHGRTLSSSTGDHGNSEFEAQEGTLRIVINRPTERQPKTANNVVQPTLEVPIPHYRIGTPRFSTQGTPILRSSAYSRISESASNIKAPVSQKPKLLFPARHSFYARDSDARPMSDVPGHTGQRLVEAQARQSTNLASPSTAPNPGTRAPAEATIFDDLIQMQDDPSVVRYSRRTGDIVAATPARIVAQISSASFMDYELVSDFFLTFRAYLSTREVLDLLLARLRWAINRLEDDGRIIRIRTFAALRHWILNYFMDDFLVNRRLRVEFCNQINEMYRKVEQRNGGGTSDLKILQDLKRCWNGRCSLYWDSDEFVIDSHQKADIVPGGVIGSRNSTLPTLPVPVEQLEQEQRQDVRPATQSWFEVPPQDRSQHSHRRQDSAAPPEGPVSIGSEKSLQPISCSIPGKSLRRSPRLPIGTKEPHPVPSASRRQLSSSDPGPYEFRKQASTTHSHKRSGSVPDSLRDRTSKNSSNQDFIFLLPHAGSLIRGNVIPPGSPYIDLLTTAPMPQGQGGLDLSQSAAVAAADMGLGIQITSNSGVKTLIGSIRRALSTRQPVNSPSPTNVVDPRAGPIQQGRKSALPLNVARSNDALRAKPVAGPNRPNLRIDLLCAEISHSYQTAQDYLHRSETATHHGPAEMANLERSLALPDPHTARATYEIEPTRRLASHATAQSGSIMIVDDTGLDIPTMSGALPVAVDAQQNDPFTSSELDSTTNAVMSTSQPTYLTVPSTPSVSQRSSGVFARRRSSSLDAGVNRAGEGCTGAAGQRYWGPLSQTSSARRSTTGLIRKRHSTATATTAIRRSASYPNDMVRHDPDKAPGEISTDLSTQDYGAKDGADAPAHKLRRRPGGDLRKVQNIHDLDTSSRHQSNDSVSSDSDSAGGSLVIMANRPKDGNVDVRPRSGKGSVSLIHTHSSQHLRPSFEAAVSGFSTIPDDDDGGLEATLLKLEGKYEKRSPNMNSASPPSQQEGRTPQTGLQNDKEYGIKSEEEAVKQDRHQPLPENAVPYLTTPVHTLKTTESVDVDNCVGISSRRSSIYGLPTGSIDGSDDSYNSVPLLERGTTDESVAGHQTPRLKPAISMPGPFSPNNRLEDVQTLSESSHPSIEMVEETASMRGIPKGSTMPTTERSPTAHSFLLDADENLSDLSSELSVDIINHSDVIARNPSPLLAAPGTALSGLEIPTHPLAHPPSPSFTLHRLATPQNVNLMMFQKPPLTPDPSPTQVQRPFSKITDHPTVVKETRDPGNSPPVASANPGHLPWILAYDSELVAEQMTLVEKAALSEVDWSDLVNMRWDNSVTTILNWVDFLSAADHKGIDLVITRFNVMVKWTLSEIVLTHNIYERAQTIMKYIHVAAHSRRLHNYATMLQITIALTSSDCSRLKKTWELVHPPERSLLKNMEALIQPLRNFHDLRVEMETADLTEGCIPFVGTSIRFQTRVSPLLIICLAGLYIHDLTYNAQKPAQIAGARDREPLINFERYRTTATIVKSLLRLIDASSRLNFPAVEGVLDRCLWIAALGDDKIHDFSRELEP
jgi:RasGEF domain/RasGEF N-terminal motif